MEHREEIRALSQSHRVKRLWLFSLRQAKFDESIAKEGLCAGLVQVWWRYRCEGRDGVAALIDPSPEIAREVVERQLRAVYFRGNPHQADLTEEEKWWFRCKYGDLTLGELRNLCKIYSADNLLELDLIMQHRARLVARASFDYYSFGLTQALMGRGEPGLRLILFRYSSTTGATRGHRVAFAVEPAGTCWLFDPNFIEVKFSSLEHFEAWFPAFWRISQYQAWVGRPMEGVPPVRVFQFSAELLATEMEEWW